MTREPIAHTDHFDGVMRILTGRGLLVGSYDASGKANLMTIGWGTIGSIWGLPMWMILVRPSRHTYAGIENSGCFTVNVPDESLTAACEICGSRSGRDIDKFAECRLTPAKASAVPAPVVVECPVVYECRVVHSNDVQPGRLDREVLAEYYPAGDFHRVYFGHIMAAFAAPDAGRRLSR